MHEMIKSGIQPNLVSFSSLIDAFAKFGKVTKAEEWFNQMLKLDVQPDAVIFNSLINACAKAGNTQKAHKWLGEMIRTPNVVPDAKTYNCLINACAKAGEIEKAEHWVAQMEKSGCEIDMITFGTVMHASAKIGNVARAEYWMDKMKRGGVTPNLVCYNTMVHACAQKGDCQRASWWMQCMRQNGVAPNKITYSSMMDVYTRVGDRASAVKMLEQMVSDGFAVDRVAFATLLRPSPKSSSGNDTPGGTVRWAYNVVIFAYLKAGNIGGLRKWSADVSTKEIPDQGRFLHEQLRTFCREVKSDHALAEMIMKAWPQVHTEDARSDRYEMDILSDGSTRASYPSSRTSSKENSQIYMNPGRFRALYAAGISDPSASDIQMECLSF
jgi:pentatricopeptide repeat protein